jgi:hypothetical protein
MKIIYKTASLLIIVLTICFWIGLTSHKQKTTQKETTIMATSRLYTEKNILEELDCAFNGVPGKFFPKGGGNIILYNFFLDLEHGYCETAGNRIHLYADKERWVVVFEKNGYQNRGGNADIELDYIGNCVEYIKENYDDYTYISNMGLIELITGKEYERVCKNDSGEDYFELINPKIESIELRGKMVKIEHDPAKYKALGIEPCKYDNPDELVGFGELIKYFNETSPDLIRAQEEEIKQHIPKDLPKIMTIDKFHFSSIYDKDIPPHEQELYQLIAKVLVNGDSSFWKPTQEPNNHWSNWESGNL